ncbi:MAG: hypothetical protein Tsb0020_09760 [Haliangiales bacterium]
MKTTAHNAAPTWPAQPLSPGLPFQVAGASVVGHEHRRLERNNQDALGWLVADDAIFAVVADGCGSSRHSEVGAKIGARLMVAALARRWSDAIGRDAAALPSWLIEPACAEVLTHLRAAAEAMGGDITRNLSDYFLFTLVGAVVTPTATVVFAIGDGVVAVNGAVQELGPFPDNRPPYLAYSLLADRSGAAPEAALTIHAQLPTPALDTLLIATDGASELSSARELRLPGRDEPAGGLDQFWRDERYFRNPDAIRRRLWLMNRAPLKPDWDRHRVARVPGLLPDDTTLIAIRRSGQERS